MIADAYFQCKPEHLSGFQMEVILDDMVTHIGTIIHAREVYRDSDKIICHCRLDEPLTNSLAEAAKVENPLDISVVVAMGITWAYLGRTLAGVFERYPELNGTKTVTDENGTREEPILLEHIWA